MTTFVEFLRNVLIPAISAYGKPGKSATLTSLADKVIASNISVAPIREWVSQLQTYGKSEAYNLEQLRFAHSFSLMVEFGYVDADKAQAVANTLVTSKGNLLLPLLDESNVYGTKKAIDETIKSVRENKRNEALARKIKSLNATVVAIAELREEGFDVDDFSTEVGNAISSLQELLASQEQVVLV